MRARRLSVLPALAVALAVLPVVIGIPSAAASVQQDDATVEDPEVYRVLIVGDGLVVDAADQLEGVCENCEVLLDAEPSRDVSTAARSVEELGTPVDLAVIVLGNDGNTDPSDVGPALAVLFDHLALTPRVVVLTVAGEDAAAGELRESIRTAADERPNVTVAEWHETAERNEGVFTENGRHLTPAGASLLAYRIATEIADARPAAPDDGDGDGDEDGIPATTPPTSEPGAAVLDPSIAIDPAEADGTPDPEGPDRADRRRTRTGLVAILGASVTTLGIGAVARRRH